MRQELLELLQESDPERALDSLERMSVLAYLVGNGMPAPPDDARLPETIEGWVRWVELSFPTS
jgi:hypothetical protein